MDGRDQQRIGDRIADWVAALSLGMAGGVSAFAAMPEVFPYAGLVAALGCAAAMASLGHIVMRRVPGVTMPLPAFDLVALPDGETRAGELLLDQPYVTAGDDTLLLDDPIEAVGGGSRVVRLFAPETIDAPGELAARIDHWLEGARGRQRPAAAAVGGHGPRSSPASAALHSALDDLRRTLR